MTCGWRGNQWFCGTGWLLAVGLLCWAAPRIYHRLISQLPAVQNENWERTLTEKKRELSSPWQDPRPLIVLAGDSEIELGGWYELFAGGWAVRNCGLSRAKIADVTQLGFGHWRTASENGGADVRHQQSRSQRAEGRLSPRL